MAPISAYRPMTVGDWILTELILMIPVAGLVMLFVWGFSDATHPSKKTLCRSLLILLAFGLGILIVFIVFFGGLAVIIGSHSPR